MFVYCGLTDLELLQRPICARCVSFLIKLVNELIEWVLADCYQRTRLSCLCYLEVSWINGFGEENLKHNER